MRFPRGERARWLSSLSIRLKYDPFDNESETGFCRPPPFPACVLDYLRAISSMPDSFQTEEMRLLMEDPASFYPLIRDDVMDEDERNDDDDDTLVMPMLD